MKGKRGRSVPYKQVDNKQQQRFPKKAVISGKTNDIT